jgi:hypothetical protein
MPLLEKFSGFSWVEDGRADDNHVIALGLVVERDGRECLLVFLLLLLVMESVGLGELLFEE